MNFNNDMNTNRVKKIVVVIEQIAKSAKSNKAENQDIWDMLQPAIDSMSGLLGVDERKEKPKAEPEVQAQSVSLPSGHVQPQWSTVREMAEQADLELLTTAMAIYLDRLHTYLADSKSNKY